MVRKAGNQKNLKRSAPPVRSASSAAKKTKESKAAKTATPVKEAKSKDAKKDVKAATKAAAGVKEAPPKKKRSKSNVVRLKAFWGVFNQMMKRIHLFEYSERRQADKKAAELSGSSKSPHFVQLVKEVIRDAD
jgi:hypothetical protein